MTTVREIVRTCSNAHVARAALASIGGDFARRFAADAARRDLSSGVLAARLVRAFAMNAEDAEWEEVDDATRGADQPILSGLRYILDHGLCVERAEANGLPGETPPAWAIGASSEGLWRE
ncbi:MAG: hypothetical protein ABR878_04695 [Roseiarcus sp.]